MKETKPKYQCGEVIVSKFRLWARAVSPARCSSPTGSSALAGGTISCTVVACRQVWQANSKGQGRDKTKISMRSSGTLQIPWAWAVSPVRCSSPTAPSGLAGGTIPCIVVAAYVVKRVKIIKGMYREVAELKDTHQKFCLWIDSIL